MSSEQIFQRTAVALTALMVVPLPVSYDVWCIAFIVDLDP